MKNFAKIALVNLMLLAPAAFNQQLVHADETELQQSSSQSDAETINKQQNKLNQNSDKDKSTDNKTAANDTNDKKPTADNKSSNANKQSRHNKQTNSALNNKQDNSAKNTSSTDDSNQTSSASSSSKVANTASINKIHQNDTDKINKPKAKTKASSKKIQKHQQTDDADLDLYLAKPGYTNSIRSQKQQNTKSTVISRKIIYHRASINSGNHQALPQASASLLPVLPNTGFKKSVWQHDNHPITLKSAALGLAACIIFLAAISIPSKRY